MRKRIYLIVALLVPVCAVDAATIVSAGQTFTFDFSQLPYQGPGTIYTYASSEWASGSDAGVDWFGTSLEPGTVVQMDIFETSLSDPPLYHANWTGAPTGGGVEFGGASGFGASHPNVWLDLQGTLSLTVLSGSLYLSEIDVYSILKRSTLNEGPGIWVYGVDFYKQTLIFGPPLPPVHFDLPEQGPGPLLTAALILGIALCSETARLRKA